MDFPTDEVYCLYLSYGEIICCCKYSRGTMYFGEKLEKTQKMIYNIICNNKKKRKQWWNLSESGGDPL